MVNWWIMERVDMLQAWLLSVYLMNTILTVFSNETRIIRTNKLIVVCLHNSAMKINELLLHTTLINLSNKMKPVTKENCFHLYKVQNQYRLLEVKEVVPLEWPQFLTRRHKKTSQVQIIFSLYNDVHFIKT